MAGKSCDTAGFRSLSRRHGIKIPVGVDFSVEECGLAVGELVGCESVKAASRMNNAVVMFLDSIDKVNSVVERGIVLRNTHTTVFPLMNPAKKIILSNLPPFISDDVLLKELSRHGQIVSAMKMLPSGCKSAKLKHVVSFRRQVFMILKNDIEELSIVMKFKVDGFDYTIFATTETMKCFGCNQEGHSVRNCPEKVQKETVQVNENPEPGTSADAVIGATVSAAGEGTPVADAGEGDQEINPGEGVSTGDQNQSNVSERDIEEVITSPEESKKSQTTTQEEMDVDDLVHSERNLIRDDESVFKVPNTKRKSRETKGVKPKKTQLKEKSGKESDSEALSDSDSDRESDSSIPDGQNTNGYSLEQIRRFLEVTKGKRDVVVDDFFPNRKLFVDSAKWLMRQRNSDGLRDTEVYRLRKLVQKVRAQLL